MESIFEKIGFSSPEAGVGLLFLLVIILFVICIALIIGVITLLVRKRDFSASVSGASKSRARAETARPTSRRPAGEKLQVLELNQRDLTANVDDLYRKVSQTYQKVGIVKYNAYSNMSGNVSFVVAMLDGNNSGFILNVINGREGSNLYIKDITNAKSSEHLGVEEVEALKIAITQ